MPRSRPTPLPLTRGGALDALRFLAAFFMVVYHYSQESPVKLQDLHPVFTRGYLATDFFLIVSGYVLGRIYGERVAANGIGMGAFSNALAVAVRKREWMFWAVQQSLLFPLLILSGMLLPLEAGPQWIQVLSRFNPLAWIVDAERALFAGTFDDPAIGWPIVAAVLTCVIGLWVGVRQVERSTS